MQSSRILWGQVTIVLLILATIKFLRSDEA